MKKLILLLIMAIVSSAFASAYVDVTYDFNVDDVEVVAFDCLDSSCSSVTDFSGSFPNGTTTSEGELTVIYPSNVQHKGYAIYYYSDSYIPKAYKADWHSNGENVHYTNSIDIDFNRLEECQAVVDEFTITNDAHANEPLVIDVSSSMDAVTSSAFSETDNGVDYIPLGYQEHYSSDVYVEMKVEAENGQVVNLQRKELSIYMDEQIPINFSWTPSNDGRYTATVKTTVTDNQCENSLDAYSSKEFTVLEERPNDEYYTILNNLDIDNSYPQEGDELEFTYTKISNYANGVGDLDSVKTDVDYYIYRDDVLVWSDSKILSANNNAVDSSEHSFKWTAEEGDYVVVIDGKAIEEHGSKDNPTDRIVLGFNVREEPLYEINFQVADSQTGNPVEDAEIHVAGKTIVTDADGKATIADLEPARYRYKAEHSDYKTVKDSVKVVDVSMDVFFTMQRDDVIINTDLEVLNSPPEVAYVAVPYEFQFEAESSYGNVEFSKVEGPKELSITKEGEVEWLPLPHDIGEHDVRVRVTDGSSVIYVEWTIDVKSKMPETESEDEEISVMQIRFPSGYRVRPGQTMSVAVLLENTGDVDMDDVRITASVPQLGIRRTIGPFDLDERDEEVRTIMIEIPAYAVKGEYVLQLSMGNEDLRRVKFRPFSIY